MTYYYFNSLLLLVSLFLSLLLVLLLIIKDYRKNTMFESWPHPKLQGLEPERGLPTQKEHPFVINDPPNAAANPVFVLQRPQRGPRSMVLGNEKFPPCVLWSAGQPCFRDFPSPSELGHVFRHCSILKYQGVCFFFIPYCKW